MRTMFVDMSEFVRRIEERIYDQDEYQKALTWVKKNCKEGDDKNYEVLKHSPNKEKEWETVIKMTLIARDLMVGNKN